MPGVPDVYQGTETWDLSLVDPDNRRPVDFAARAARLDWLRRRTAPDGSIPAATIREMRAGWRDGDVKLLVVARLLALRARLPALFARGRYVPLPVSGRRAAHVIAFARVHAARRCS